MPQLLCLFLGHWFLLRISKVRTGTDSVPNCLGFVVLLLFGLWLGQHVHVPPLQMTAGQKRQGHRECLEPRPGKMKRRMSRIVALGMMRLHEQVLDPASWESGIPSNFFVASPEALCSKTKTEEHREEKAPGPSVLSEAPCTTM